MKFIPVEGRQALGAFASLPLLNRTLTFTNVHHKFFIGRFPNTQIVSRSARVLRLATNASDIVDRRAGRSTYRPNSFTEIVNDAIQAVLTGLEDGLTRMEVEFPAVSNVDGRHPCLYQATNI